MTGLKMQTSRIGFYQLMERHRLAAKDVKTFELSNMGVQALKDHAVGKKHKKAAEAVTCFFKKPS